MNERELLEKLLLNEHLSVPERKRLPSGKAKKKIMEAIIADHLKSNGQFPNRFKLEDPFAGGLILKTEDGGFHVYRKAEIGLCKFGLVAKETYPDPIAAAQAYLRLTHKDQIDGIPME